jgi:3-oxoacyl-[acyl-carrier protein] reductase
VTGAARGIGAAIARRLAADRFAVAINYRQSQDAAEGLAQELRDGGGKALAIGADIAERTAVDAMVAEIETRLGPIDTLVNNAGVMVRGDLDDFDRAQMEWMRRTNVDGLVQVTGLVSRGMKTRRFGRIINLTSIAGHGTSMAGTTFYAATKAAVSVLTRRFALALGPFGITVNAVAPGFILTDMVATGRTAEDLENVRSTMASRAMVGRTGTPEDIAHVVSFLADERSGFVTAQVITADGGRTDYIAHP